MSTRTRGAAGQASQLDTPELGQQGVESRLVALGGQANQLNGPIRVEVEQPRLAASQAQQGGAQVLPGQRGRPQAKLLGEVESGPMRPTVTFEQRLPGLQVHRPSDRKSTRLNSSH